MKTYWFVDSFYHASGAPKMERELMNHMRWFQHYVLSTEDLDILVQALSKFQEKCLSLSSRCKPVTISRSSIVSATYRCDASVYIHIGSSTVTLTRVKNSDEIKLEHFEQEVRAMINPTI